MSRGWVVWVRVRVSRVRVSRVSRGEGKQG